MEKSVEVIGTCVFSERQPSHILDWRCSFIHMQIYKKKIERINKLGVTEASEVLRGTQEIRQRRQQA